MYSLFRDIDWNADIDRSKTVYRPVLLVYTRIFVCLHFKYRLFKSNTLIRDYILTYQTQLVLVIYQSIKQNEKAK
jgi:hypothetical protein